MRFPIKKTTWALLSLLLLPGEVCAHGFCEYASTPITPPLELLWVLPVYGVAFVAGNTWFGRKRLGMGLGRSLFGSMGFLLCFAVSFFLLGSFFAGICTAPLPGLGLPGPAFRGFGWAKSAGIFIGWNLVGLLFLLAWSFRFARPRSFAETPQRPLVNGNLALYFICLLPFAFSGALSHGWCGGYVSMHCESQLERLHAALFTYAEKHEGRFPTADGMPSLLNELKPYLSGDDDWIPEESAVCPLLDAYAAKPRHYIWNEKYSGFDLRQIDTDDKLAEALSSLKEDAITCPREGHGGRILFDQLSDYVECRNRLSRLHAALFAYAEKHEGRFPTADDLPSLLKTLLPYLPVYDDWKSPPFGVCTHFQAYSGGSNQYIWNREYSGFDLRQIDKADKLAEAASYPKKDAISCRYEGHGGGIMPLLLSDYRSKQGNPTPHP